MIGLAILLGGAAVAQALARWLNLPASPFVLLIGFLLGQLGFLPREILQDALVLGLTFLLLVLGIELNPRRLRVRKHRRVAVTVAVLQFVTLGTAGLLASLALGLGLHAASYIGIALAASSTLVVIRILQRSGRLYEPFGRLVVGVLLIQDALIVLSMPVVLRAAGGAHAILAGILGTLAMLALAVIVMRWLVPRFARLQDEEEELLVVVLTVPAVFIWLASLLGLPLAAGAFVGGFALSPFPTSGVVRAQVASVGDFFTPVFFLALGGILVTPGIGTLLRALLIAAVVLLVTSPLVAFLVERAGFEARAALESGLILSQTSELSLVLGLQALLAGQIEQETFTVLALATIVTMVATPYLLSERLVHRLLRLRPVRQEAPSADRPSGHIVMLGCGSGGMPLLETLLMSGEEVVVIDDDADVINRLRSADVQCFHGDASDENVLRRAGADQARIVSSTIRRPRDNAKALELLRGRLILVRVFEDEDSEWVEGLGGIPVLYSEAAAEEFMTWFIRTRQN